MNMTMTYDGTMVMPNNYAVVTEDEMTYVDGGVYTSAIKTLKTAQSFFEGALFGYLMGTAVSAIGTTAFLGFVVTDIFFGYNSWRTFDCLHKVNKWISQYGDNKLCKIGMDVWFGFVVGGLDVELV